MFLIFSYFFFLVLGWRQWLFKLIVQAIHIISISLQLRKNPVFLLLPFPWWHVSPLLCSFLLENLLIMKKSIQFMPLFRLNFECSQATKISSLLSFKSTLVVRFIIIFKFLFLEFIFMYVCSKLINVVYILLLLSILLFSADIKINTGPNVK